MKRTPPQGRSQRAAFYLPVVVFLLSALISAAVTWYVTGTYLDSDAASELILAKHLAQTGQLLSKDWIYGSEFRVLHMQLVYAPLMLLLSDWHVIRFTGALILQGLYILSFRYLTRQAGLHRNAFWYGASLLLLPVSVTYGRIVLYHCHYLPNITISFCIYGLVLHLRRVWNPRQVKSWALAACLTLLSFLGGVNSLRQLMITHAPMLLSILVLCLYRDRTGSEAAPALLSKPVLPALIFAVLAAACSVLGLLFNTIVLQGQLTTALQYDTTNMGFMDAKWTQFIAYGFFHQFGFRQQVPMISVQGILSLGSLVAGCFALAVSARAIWKPGNTLPQVLVYAGLASYTAVMLMVFLVTGGEYYYPLYLSLCWPWAVLPLMEALGDNPEKLPPLHGKRLLAWVSALVLLVSGTVNLAWFRGAPSISQTYEGLGFQNRDIKAQLSGAADYLTQNGYTIGYAPYWNANVLTEATNGAVQMIGVNITQEDGNVTYNNCLTLLWLREAPNDKPFLLLPSEEPLPQEVAACCTPAYGDDWFRVYDITDPETFGMLLYS